MNSKDITLWIDQRWYDALSKHLKDETLEEHLEDVIDEMCNQLPQREYERISAEIWKEDQEERKAREATRRFAVFHVTEGGSSTYFLAEEHLEFLQTANRLRSYIRKAEGDPPARFTGMFPRGEKLSREQSTHMCWSDWTTPDEWWVHTTLTWTVSGSMHSTSWTAGSDSAFRMSAPPPTSP